MANKDYYATLGIDKNASESEIQKAYRQMANKYHPDNNPGDNSAEENMKEVNQAYEVLSDPDKKAKYDQFGSAAFEQGGMGGGGFYGGPGGMDFDMGDIFNMFGFGGGSSSRRNGPQRGSDIGVNIQITFEEAIFGTKKDISVNVIDKCDTCGGTGAKPGTHAETCRRCNGTGQERVVKQSIFGTMTSVQTCSACGGTGKTIKDPCPTCHGKGRVRKTKKFEVNIPKGIDNGQTIRLSGKGEAGINGGPNGDLMVTVYVKADSYFTRRGMDLYCEVPITFVQAALGDEITVRTVDGTQKVTVKPGTQPDATMTIRGVGVPNLRNNAQRGNQIITFKVKIPTDLTARQKELLREFAGKTEGSEKSEKKGFWDKLKEKMED